MKKVLFLGSSLALVIIASCSSSGGGPGGPDGGPGAAESGAPPLTGAAKSIFDGLVLPPGSEEREDAPEDSSISVPMGSSASSPSEVAPGSVMNVRIPFDAPGKNVVGAGIRFAPSGPFKFVPIGGAQGQTGGTLAVQIQAPAQSALCGQLSSICHSIKCYEFAVTSEGKISRANITDLAVKCGNCTEPSCKGLLQSCNLDASTDSGDAGKCSSVQTAGADAPETRTIEMGRTTGTFNFKWDMYSKQDRMIVSYGGMQLHDTGCVSGAGTKALTFNGSSSQITVNVQPNCTGGTGTAWEFTVDCPQ